MVKREQSAGQTAQRFALCCSGATPALHIVSADGCQIAGFKGFPRVFSGADRPGKPPVTTITAAPH
jgi:hypothetical protein